ncbi:MAG: hypothetical protein A2499_15440 [Stygiobacter sp. RIFOXYC12_FULL_38_8]|nr:MAG: hypothetical protein A2279_00350 [Stygiobacter sp. RIFOXYA12_FULL_38_9]OGV09413.1 MAG: hypothetical protein A2299_13720 [Stygiobacter sp. RIFOXYB2_FULL_37_11]OGV15360.1 MAG: hypothetical protein A2440_07955 [Stygiobacter sp. RIFOXYC2_FULL_38_25]OGV27795.1 MAG: hypothetical protein A2499_15440 [Stygiobacter sp. RIFOXYC12_FULL_38_8]OGV79098.1 MAG: hypothetical protein A2X65_08405 [Stygiobacter sp. GWF2_38_21]RJQ64398.1 MAG: hypothetical protein C4517_02695 [Stygiobacter sp.]
MKRFVRIKNRLKNKDSIFTKINSISTFILVLITAYYAYQTSILTSISSNQMLLAVEPNVELESKLFTQIDSGKFHFSLSNLSPADLKNIQLYSKYYTHIIDNELNEYFLIRGIESIAPDTTLTSLKANSKNAIYFDYSRSGLLSKDTTSSFYVGDINKPVNIPMQRINKFYNTTFAEYKIEYQRELDGKFFTKIFYYLLALKEDSANAQLIRNTKDNIIGSNQRAARMLKMIKSNK